MTLRAGQGGARNKIGRTRDDGASKPRLSKPGPHKPCLHRPCQAKPITSVGSLTAQYSFPLAIPAARILNIDLVAVLVAVMLPWSTSGVAIGMVLWLAALIPTVAWRALLQYAEAAGLSAADCFRSCWPLVGTLWSDAPWGARSYALSPTAKLLVLPLLFYHFERSTRGMWVFIAFLVSCVLLMAMSWLVMFDPGSLAQACRRRARNLRQELYRPEPGIRALRGSAGLSRHHVVAGEENLAGAAVDCRSR